MFSFLSFSTFGTPDENTWPGVTQLPDYKCTFPKWPATHLGDSVDNLDLDGLDLLKVVTCDYSRLSDC